MLVKSRDGFYNFLETMQRIGVAVYNVCMALAWLIGAMVLYFFQRMLNHEK